MTPLPTRPGNSRLRAVAILAGVAAGFALGLALSTRAPSEAPRPAAVARVGQREISRAEFDRYAKFRRLSRGIAGDPELLEELVQRTLLVLAARTADVPGAPVLAQAAIRERLRIATAQPGGMKSLRDQSRITDADLMAEVGLELLARRASERLLADAKSRQELVDELRRRFIVEIL